MKKQIALALTLIISAVSFAQNKKGEQEKNPAENWTANQFIMLDEFSKAGTVYYTRFADNNKLDEIREKAMGEWFLVNKKDEQGRVSDCKFGDQYRVPQNMIYPLYYKNRTNQNERTYIINGYCFHIFDAPMKSAEDVDKYLAGTKNIVTVAANAKGLLKGFTFEKAKEMLRHYLKEAGAEADKLIAVSAPSNASGDFTCKNFTMHADGDKICEYLDAKDGKTRKVFATISNDTVIYTVIRINDDNTIFVMKKWKIYIGIINNSSPYFGVFSWMNGTEKIHKVTLPVVSGQKYIWTEFFCESSTKPVQVSSSDNLDLSFSDEAAAKAFFEKVKSIRSNLATPGTAGTSTAGGSTKLNGNIRIVNKTESDIWIRTEGSGSFTHIAPKGSTSISCSVYQGKKVYLTDKNGKEQQVLFTIDSDLCQKGEYIWGK